MPVKIRLLCTFIGGVLIGSIAPRFFGTQYEFHHDSKLPMIWRSDKRTGRTELSIAGQPWKLVEAPAWVPPEAR